MKLLTQYQFNNKKLEYAKRLTYYYSVVIDSTTTFYFVIEDVDNIINEEAIFYNYMQILVNEEKRTLYANYCLLFQLDTISYMQRLSTIKFNYVSGVMNVDECVEGVK